MCFIINLLWLHSITSLSNLDIVIKLWSNKNIQPQLKQAGDNVLNLDTKQVQQSSREMLHIGSLCLEHNKMPQVLLIISQSFCMHSMQMLSIVSPVHSETLDPLPHCDRCSWFSSDCSLQAFLHLLILGLHCVWNVTLLQHYVKTLDLFI